MYHGIVFDSEFSDPLYPEQLEIFARRKSSTTGWTLYGIVVSDEKIEELISEVQANMKSDKPYYAHFYNDNKLLVVFKEKVFEATPHISTWKPINEYGKQLNIPEEQLDFWPNRFQDEIHYFKKEDFEK